MLSKVEQFVTKVESDPCIRTFLEKIETSGGKVEPIAKKGEVFAAKVEHFVTKVESAPYIRTSPGESRN